MKESFIRNSVNLIKKYNAKYTEDDYEKMRYGLEGIYLTITKVIIILLLSIILGISKELILVLLFFNIIRFPAFGVHADKSIVCLITSAILILGLTFFFYKIDTSINVKTILVIISYINYPLFAPADTVKRPLTNERKRKYRKIASCIIAFVYSLIALLFNNMLSRAILVSLILEAIMINPLTYKLYGMPYNNCKKTV